MNSPFSALAYEFEFTDPQRGFSRRCSSAGTEALDFRDQGYEFPYVRLASTFTRSLPSNLIDLLDIAIAIYLADRFSPRRHAGRKRGPLHQHRAISVCLPVSNRAFWSSKEVTSLLEEALRFLTGDSWNFTFKAMSKAAVPVACQQIYLFDLPPEREPKVMLFSGGLDSFAGAVHQLEDPERFHILVSGSTHNRMADGQQKQAHRLFAGRPYVGQHVIISHGLVAKPTDLPLESSQRSRGFLHISLGAAAGLFLGSHELSVYENGIGAINLPFDASQVGVENSHAVHPKFLWLMERLLARISGTPFFIRTPFLFLTKAEALRHPRMRDFGAGIAETFSCDRFPNWHEHRPQCGACPSCVLRRMSLEAAGLADLDPAAGYTSGINESSASLNSAAAFVLEKFDAQAHRLHKLLATERPWAVLSRAYPELREVQHALFKCSGLSPDEVESRLLRLYGKHADEWKAFSGSRTLERHLCAAA
jgi:7-cyano-7-deazaguanine synthase in queuosine biosynthesis